MQLSNSAKLVPEIRIVEYIKSLFLKTAEVFSAQFPWAPTPFLRRFPGGLRKFGMWGYFADHCMGCINFKPTKIKFVLSTSAPPACGESGASFVHGSPGRQQFRRVGWRGGFKPREPRGRIFRGSPRCWPTLPIRYITSVSPTPRSGGEWFTSLKPGGG